MTKFLNNTGLARLVALIKQALGGKADKMELPLVVTFTGVGDNISCDTSIADIYAAYSTGRVVQMKLDVLSLTLSLVLSTSSEATFAATAEDNSVTISGTNENGSDVWTMNSFVAQEELTFDSTPTTDSQNPVTSGGVKTALDGKQATLVSGTNIKNINNASILGSGNIDLKPTDFLIIVTQSGSSITADKTYEQITTAFNAGRNLIVKKGDDVFHISHENGREFVFVSEGKMGKQFRYKLTLTSQGEWVYLFESIDATEISIVNDDTHGRWYNGDQVEEALVALSDAIDDLGTPNEITSITTTESTASGGNNTVTINTTDGTSKTFNVKNGVDGADGVSLGEISLVQTTGDATDAVMSQKAVTEYGRKVTAEDLNGTSDWIKARLTEEGWKFRKVLNNDGTVGSTSNWMCISPMFPCSTNHSFLFQPKKSNNSGNCMLAFYNDSDAFKGSTIVTVIDGTQTYTPTDSTITQLRFSCNMNDLPNVFVKDTTTDEYIFKGDEVVKNLIANSGNIVSYDVLEGSIIKHTSGESSISLMSQRAITDAIAKQNGFEASEGMATINYFPVYTKLTQRQVERLNSGEVATFHILAKPVKSHPSGMYGASFFMSRDSLGYSIYQNAGSIIVNGITIVTYNTIGMFPVSRYFVCDRVNGVVRLYTGTKLLAEVQNDSFKKDKFIGDDGIFYFHSGYYKAVLYEMKIFDFDAFSLSYNDTIFDYNLRDAEVATMNPDSVKNALNLFDTTVYTKNKPTVATNNAQYSRTTDSEGYSTISVSPTATTTCILQQNPHSFDTSNGNVRKYGQSMVKEIIFDLEVISGNINLATNIIGDALEIKKVIDESGNIIDDASNCGIGVYHIHIITSNPNTGIIKSAGVSCVFRLLSASIKMLCCVAHLSFNKWYNGEIYDDEADTYYHLYSDASLSKEPTNVALSPEVARRSGTLKLNYPQFIGQIAITSSGIFIGNQDYTWKQINNS